MQRPTLCLPTLSLASGPVGFIQRPAGSPVGFLYHLVPQATNHTCSYAGRKEFHMGDRLIGRNRRLWLCRLGFRLVVYLLRGVEIGVFVNKLFAMLYQPLPLCFQFCQLLKIIAEASAIKRHPNKVRSRNRTDFAITIFAPTAPFLVCGVGSNGIPPIALSV